MTSPRVIELPRRLEPVSPDTFLGVVLAFPPPVRGAGVVTQRPRAARGLDGRPAPAPAPPPPAAA